LDKKSNRGVDKIKQEYELVMSGVVIFMVLLVVGCLGPDQQPLRADAASIKCSESVMSGQIMTVNETENNATICARLNSSIMIKLSDASRTGYEWSITTSPGLQISDEGVTWYDEIGIPPTSLIEYGVHEWNVTMNSTGIQTIKAILRFPGREITGDEKKFNLTIVVE
jgi:predicted secreted protein